MEAKEKAIREAYGEHWEIVKQQVDENGWLYHPRGGEVTFDPWIGFMEEHPTDDAYRPKSLAGIENNRGWIRIESEADLPNEDGWHWIKYLGDEFVCFWANHKYCFVDNDNSYFLKNVTHYQPIIKPLKPIY